MPTRKADVVASAFAGALNAIPACLRKTLTYDQGKEMAQHESLALSTGMRIFFADPHSPWQRGSNENTNGLLRQYFPKAASLAGFDQADLDTVADSLNGRPRKTLDYATPSEQFRSLLAEQAAANKPPGAGVRSGY
jgi:IS30 family transposase